MNRLNYKLPVEWTRITWASGNSKKIWEQRITAFSQIFNEIEEMSVGKIRDAAILIIPGELLTDKINACISNNTVLVPLHKVPKTDSYTSSIVEWDGKSPVDYRVAICKDFETANKFKKAWNDGIPNSVEIGKLLGYPECCCNFFKKYWDDEKFLDLSWPTYENSNNSAVGSPESNSLLRWIGVRTVSHMACSFDCKHTIELSNKYKSLIDTLNITDNDKIMFREHWDYALQLLSMPTQWSAKHGVAIIKTPLFKISTRTDATGELYTINKDGEFYPPEAPAGNSFPYKPTVKNILTKGMSFKKSLEAIDPSSEWLDNGFNTLAGMTKSHDSIINFIKENVLLFDQVIDLGCGNGLFLNKIKNISEINTQMYGVEHKFEIAKRAQFRYPEFIIHNEDIFDENCVWKDNKYKIGFISANRIFEQSTAIEFTIHKLLQRINTLIITDYGDPIKSMELIQTNSLFIVLNRTNNCIIVSKLTV